jgi:hypothetical protein
VPCRQKYQPSVRGRLNCGLDALGECASDHPVRLAEFCEAASESEPNARDLGLELRIDSEVVGVVDVNCELS